MVLGDDMKFKKILAKSLIALCAISIIALVVVIFAGCSSSELDNKNYNNYEIEIEYNDENKTLLCSELLSYKNNTDTTLNFVCLNLYPNAFREESISPPVSLANQHKAYPNGKSYGNITISSVSVLQNTATYCNSFDITQPTYSEIAEFAKTSAMQNDEYFIGGEDENILYIIFKTPLYPDERREIEINFEVVLPNINHRFGYGENTVNLANFYPIACVYQEGDFVKELYHYNGDPFFSDMANYNVTLTCPSNFVVASTGKQTGQTQGENSSTYQYSANSVRDFAIVLSSEFTLISKTVGKTEVNYFYFSDEDPNQSLEISAKALSFFNDTIGDYPYPTLNVVEANFVHGGMEFPNLVYISNDVADRTTYNQVIVHEIAHQWWYNLVGSSAFDYGWLDEGLTEYSTALFFEQHEEYDISFDKLISNAYSTFSLFVTLYQNVYGEVDTSMNRPLDEYDSEQEYVYIAYVKGLLLFDSLREILGEKTFIKCLQNYFEEYKFQNVTPSHLIASFEKTSNVSLQSYFNAWINGDIILVK